MALGCINVLQPTTVSVRASDGRIRQRRKRYDWLIVKFDSIWWYSQWPRSSILITDTVLLYCMPSCLCLLLNKLVINNCIVFSVLYTLFYAKCKWTFSYCIIHILFLVESIWSGNHHHTTTIFTALFLEPPGWAGARRELLTLWCKGRVTEADTPTIRLGATPSGLTSAHLHHPPIFTGRMPFLPPNQQCQSTEGN